MIKKYNLKRNTIVPSRTSSNSMNRISSSRIEFLKNKKKEEEKKPYAPNISISLMVHTASMDHFLKTKGIDSYFEALTSCLKKQSFKKFELIYVDTFCDENKKNFSELISTLPFQVKHVKIHHEHRYWYDKGNTYISAAKNTGILYADGELCVTCDDAEFFPNNLLKLYWEEYRRGRLMIALHKRLKSVGADNGKLIMPISGHEYINDSRFEQLENKNYKIHNIGTLTFAGTSFALKDAIFLNGFNEKMDGCKSLEDCDFGVRMSLIGKKFSMLREGYLYILEHPSYSDAVVDSIVSQKLGSAPKSQSTMKKISNFVAIENYSMIQCARKLLDLKANKGPITDRHIEIIKEETIRYRGFDPTDKNHIDNFKVWLDCPNFDLEKQRKELRESSEWIWKKQ